MDVYILIRGDQSDHGYVETSVEGVFAKESDALDVKVSEEDEARAAGSRVCGDSCRWHESDWQVSWMIERAELQ